MQIHDDVFIQEFETLTLNPEYFNHLGHIRLAWLYLHKYEQAEAERRVCMGIKRYAQSLGAINKFHLTLTVGLVRIIARRMQQQTTTDWQSFVTENSDLTTDALEVLNQHFSTKLLQSQDAKTQLVEPDLRAI